MDEQPHIQIRQTGPSGQTGALSLTIGQVIRKEERTRRLKDLPSVDLGGSWFWRTPRFLGVTCQLRIKNDSMILSYGR